MFCFFFFFKKKPAYEFYYGLVGSEMCIGAGGWGGRGGDDRDLNMRGTHIGEGGGIMGVVPAFCMERGWRGERGGSGGVRPRRAGQGKF